MTFRAFACPVLLLLLAGDAGLVSRASAQTAPPPAPQTLAPQPPPPAQSSSGSSLTLPVDLSKIRKQLESPDPTDQFDLRKTTGGMLRFYAQTVEKGPTFKELTVGFNLRTGPVPGASMTHSEFLSMVTPKELYGSGGISVREQLEWGLVNWAALWTIKRLYREYDEAKSEWRKAQIKSQIDRELAALKGGT